MRDVIEVARFAEGHWTEQPVLVLTHWRGLSRDLGISPDTEHLEPESAAAQGVCFGVEAGIQGVNLRRMSAVSELRLAKRTCVDASNYSDRTGSTICSVDDGASRPWLHRWESDLNKRLKLPFLQCFTLAPALSSG
ncbi:hypothetical protein [Caballeronia sp. RCC_10]|uniref:hypothetical protein n=1 Tax=Caballeronia sp. RCC_10 TaxID=3239227 RepID=UPI003525478D